MKIPYSEVVIIYNPNSTGESKKNARLLKGMLSKSLPAVEIRLYATKHAGHAETIGASYAKKDTKTLLVSSSGDGGYNELINGVLKHKTKHVSVCVLPSGNANDHYHAINGESVARTVIRGTIREMDVIKVTASMDGKPWQRYAHSYVGVGLTAYVGKKLTEAKLNAFNEKWLVLKHLFLFRHTTLKIDHAKQWQRYTSVVVANIDRMSKVTKLSEEAKLDDGELELYEEKQHSFLAILWAGLSASVVGTAPTRHITSVVMQAKRAIEIQCDGEVFQLDKDKDITVSVVKKAIRTII